jgi:hypothetical protein
MSCGLSAARSTGATRTTAMMHIAVQEALNGSPVDWMEQVSDQQYPDFA